MLKNESIVMKSGISSSIDISLMLLYTVLLNTIQLYFVDELDLIYIQKSNK